MREWHPPTFTKEDLPPEVATNLKELLRGHFFIPSDTDEVVHLKARYEHARSHFRLLVTITTTMDCNLDCYYCYENKSKVYLSKRGCDRILNWIEERVELKDEEKLHTDWYGGEPMLNKDAIDYFSERTIALCAAKGMHYDAAMISNGTLWPEDSRAFVERNRIRHVQFTLDGPRDYHNKRRRYVSKDQRQNSFDAIVSTIDRLIGALRIYVRINVDPWLGRDVLSLVEFFNDKGWLSDSSRFYPYLAAIGPLTEHCSFLGSQEFRDLPAEFDSLNHEFQKRLAQYIDPRAIQHLLYYPMTKMINCAAVVDNSVIFGPDGLMYKCALEVGDAHRAQDRLDDFAATKDGLPFVILNNVKETLSPQRWREYDPFSHPECSQCQYLPICLGGCPKAHIDRNEFYVKAHCKYWEDNFDRIIRTYYDTGIQPRKIRKHSGID